METKRQRQVAETIKRNFGQVLQSEGSYIYGSDPFVTVTSVNMSPDMSIAKIYLSVYNIDDKQNVILEMDEENTRLRGALAHRIKRHVRRIPEIQFYLDDTLDEMYRLNEIFDKIEDKQHDDNGEEE